MARSRARCASQQGQGSVASFGTTVFSSAGLLGRIYFIPEGSRELPHLGSLQPVGVIYTPSLNVPAQHWLAGFPGVTQRFEWFAIDYRGNFWVGKAGMYQFALLLDDGARLYIDDQLIIDNDGQHPPETRLSSLNLNRGFHKLRVPYFQGPRDMIALSLSVAGAGERLRVFSTDEFKAPSNAENWKDPASLQPTNSIEEISESVVETDPLPKFTSTVVIPGGLTAHVHRISRRARQVPELTARSIVATFYSPAVGLPGRYGSQHHPAALAIEYGGNFWIESPGLYRFAVIAEDGAKLYIDGQLVDDDDQPHDFQRNRRSCSLWLGAGAHKLQLQFFHTSRSEPLLTLLAAGPGESLREFTTEEFRPPRNAEEKLKP